MSSYFFLFCSLKKRKRPFDRGVFIISLRYRVSLTLRTVKFSDSYCFMNSWTITIVNARKVQIIVFAVKGDSDRKYHVIRGNVTYETENAINLEVHNCGVQSIICLVP